MSLVLNTNSSGGGDNILSNQYLETNYPDIDNAILLFPDRRNSNGAALATINGIAAKMLGGVISKDDLNNLRIPPTNTSYTGKPPRVGTAISTGNNNLVAVLPIDGLIGSVIGKKIVLPTLFMSSNYFANITCRTGILHSDGTITYFHEAVGYISKNTYTNDPGVNSRDKRMVGDYGNSFYEGEATTKYITTSGIVVQAGDRPIFQIISTQGSLFVNFGSLTPTEPKFKLQPVQISID